MKTRMTMLVVLLVTMICLMLLPGMAGAETISWTMDEDSGVLTISGTGEMTSHPWTENNAAAIREVVVEEGVTSICTDAFIGCANMTKITLPRSLQYLGGAFGGCDSLAIFQFNCIEEDENLIKLTRGGDLGPYWQAVHLYIPSALAPETAVTQITSVKANGVELTPTENGHYNVENYQDLQLSFTGSVIPGYTREYRVVSEYGIILARVAEDGSVTDYTINTDEKPRNENTRDILVWTVYIPDENSESDTILISKSEPITLEFLPPKQINAEIITGPSLYTKNPTGYPISISIPEEVLNHPIYNWNLYVYDKEFNNVYNRRTDNPDATLTGSNTILIPDNLLTGREQHTVIFNLEVTGYEWFEKIFTFMVEDAAPDTPAVEFTITDSEGHSPTYEVEGQTQNGFLTGQEYRMAITKTEYWDQALTALQVWCDEEVAFLPITDGEIDMNGIVPITFMSGSNHVFIYGTTDPIPEDEAGLPAMEWHIVSSAMTVNAEAPYGELEPVYVNSAKDMYTLFETPEVTVSKVANAEKYDIRVIGFYDRVVYYSETLTSDEFGEEDSKTFQIPRGILREGTTSYSFIVTCTKAGYRDSTGKTEFFAEKIGSGSCLHEEWENGVCANCGITCPHSYTADQESWAEDTVISSISDSYHHISGIKTTIKKCRICGKTINLYEQQYDTDEPHSYCYTEAGTEPAVCTVCEHENGCRHEDHYETVEWDEGVVYTQKDELFHRVQGTATVREVCSACWMYLSVTKEENTARLERHSFDSEGRCVVCGYQCQHNGTNHTFEIYDWDNATYADSGDNEFHTVSGEGVERCEICYIALNEPGNQTISFTAAHSYNNGICMDCGHVCTHEFDSNGWCPICGNYCPHSSLGEEKTREVEGRFCENYDETGHKVYSRKRETYQICEECGYENIINIEYLNQTGFEAHAYIHDGFCECSAACPHIGIQNAESTSFVTEEAQWFRKDAAHHVMATILETWATCPVCGQDVRLSQEIAEVTEGTEEACEFDADGWCMKCQSFCPHEAWENGICTNCGMACSHWETDYQVSWSEDTVYSSIDDTCHHVNGTRIESYICRNCGMTVNTYEQQLEEDQFHSYCLTEPGEETRVCTICGHINECSHEGHHEMIAWEEGATFTPIDERTHRATGPATILEKCPVCLIYLSATNTESIERTEEHDFDAEGKCILCGYQCQHPEAAHQVDLYDWNSAVYTDTGDNEFHTAAGEGFERCEICGVTLDETTGQTISITERHHYSDGNCQDCGHVCTHAFAGGWCPYCGTSYQGSINWEVDESVLIITGEGAIPDYDAGRAPWAGYADSIDQIVLGQNITRIGDNAFNGFTASALRVEFNQASLPDISESAFAGTNAIFRYYTNHDSWPTGYNWVYLPIDNQDGRTYQTIGYSAEEGWWLETGPSKVYMSAKQAKEETFRVRGIRLNDLPSAAEFEDVCCDWQVTFNIAFAGNCSGNMTLQIPRSSFGASISCEAAGMNLTVTSEVKMQILDVEAGTVSYTGDADYLELRTPEDGQTADVTVNGNIGTLNLRSGNDWDAYQGSLTLNGSITNGYVYSSASITVPNVPVPVDFDWIPNVNLSIDTNGESQTIIRNGEITLAGAELDPQDLYYFRYELQGNQWYVGVRPKDDLNLAMPQAVSLASYKPDFSESDIAYGPRTDISIYNADEEVTLDGQIYELLVWNSSVTANGPVLMLDEGATTPYHLTINNRVDYLYVRDRSDSNIYLGTNGYVGQGFWYRRLRGVAYFDTIGGAIDLYSNGQMHVMSWKNGQMIAAILPSDDTVTAAAGLSDGMKASADISESSTAEMNTGEINELNRFLAETGDEAAMVFDATITSYILDENGNAIEGSNITSLNSEIEFQVSNNTGDACYVLRLHEENGTVTATQLTEPSESSAIAFESSLFSKYVLVKENEEQPQNPPTDSVSSNVQTFYAPDGEKKALYITANGPIDTADAEQWAEFKDEIDIIYLIGDITRIGDNVFDGFTRDGLRVDFSQNRMPEISETAFSGCGNIICRYYSDDTTWTFGESCFGAESVQWIRLPISTEGSFESAAYFDYTEDGWQLTLFNDSTFWDRYPETAAQAKESAWGKYRVFNFYSIPATEEDQSLYEGWQHVQRIEVRDGCTGTLDITLPTGNSLFSVYIESDNATVTITNPERLNELRYGPGVVTYNGDIQDLILADTFSGEDLISVNGDVGRLSFYTERLGNAYQGSMILNGTVETGTVLGTTTLDIPGVGMKETDGLASATFRNVTMTNEVLIDHGVLQAETTQTQVTLDMYNPIYLIYEIGSNRSISLLLRPKDEFASVIGSESIRCDNLDITTDQFIYGEDTEITFQTTARNGRIVLNGKTEDGELKGVRSIYFMHGWAEINCPVGRIETDNAVNFAEGINLTINNHVDNLYIRKLNRGTIVLGTEGSVTDGTWNRRSQATRIFGPVSTPGTLYAGNSLNAMSRREGETLQALLPTEDELTIAAGIGNGDIASAEIRESSMDELNSTEEEALEEFLAKNGGTVAAVFDTTITRYSLDENENVLPGSRIFTLNEPVAFKISNEANEKAYVVRLHEEDGGMTATAVSEATTDETIEFRSDLFSKFVLVTGEGNVIDPSTLNTLRLPEGLTRIEDSAFEGGAFEAVIIPDGCEYIGHGAFRDCIELISVSYPAGATFEEDAFDGCVKLVQKEARE